MSERDTSLIPDDLDQDTYDAARYLLLRERYPRSMEDIANEFGISRQGLYRRLDRWERTGALEKAREVLLVPMVEEIRAANDEVVRRWPEILERVVNIALNSRSDHVSMEAAAWLNEHVVQPTIESKQEPGAAEQEYARRGKVFNPTVIDAAVKVIGVRTNPPPRENGSRAGD